MARPDKAASVAEIADAFRDSTASVLTEYRGLSVSQLTELRRAFGSGARYAIVKNTLTKIAAREAGLTDLDALLEGPTAIAFVSGDAVEAARGVRDFARAHPLLIVKGGVLDGRTISADEIRRLADLESREVLLAKLAGAMKGSLSQAAGLFAAPLSQVARLAEALRQKAEQDPTILRGGAGTPPVVDEAVPASVEDAAPVEDTASVEDPPAAEGATVEAPAADDASRADEPPAVEPAAADASPAAE